MIYYTTDVEKQVTADELATIITSLKAFESSTQQGSAQASRTETGQSECYYSFREGGYTLHFIGLRLSDKNRVIAAVVVGGEEVHHFALEFTAHEYDKTLVGNSIRLENWKERLLNYISYSCTMPTQPVAEEPLEQKIRLKNRHNKVLQLTVEQEEIDEGDMAKIVCCFGVPGSGKTLLVSGFIDRCIEAGRATLFVGPEEKLIQLVKESIPSRFSEEQRQLASIYSWENFLALLVEKAELPREFLHDKKSQRLVTREVFYQHLSPSHTPSKAIRILLKNYPIEVLFQEYQHVFLQANWINPEAFFLTQEEYLALGRGQSRINKEDRASVYMHLKSFYDKVSEPDSGSRYYDRVITTKKIYLHLLQVSFKPFRAIAIDETQCLHPLQLACILSTSTCEEGHVFLASDPLQNIDSQPLAFIRPLEDYLKHWHFDRLLQIAHLETTHRATILLSQMSKIWRNILLRLVGPDELKTFSQMRLDERQALGAIRFSSYNEVLKTKIESDPHAMILVSHEGGGVDRWNGSHTSTINEYQGLSAKTIVIDEGIFDFYKQELNELNKRLQGEDKDADPFHLDTQLVAARQLKSETPVPLKLIQAIKALFIAFSRAEEQLIFINPPEILKDMIALVYKKHGASSIPPHAPEPRHCTPQEGDSPSRTIERADTDRLAQADDRSIKCWLDRFTGNIKQGQLSQAYSLLIRKELWGDHAPAFNALVVSLEQKKEMSEFDKQAIIAQAHRILFPTVKQAPLVAVASSAVVASAAPTPAESVPVKALISDPEEILKPLDKKWSTFAEDLCNPKNMSIANLKKAFDLTPLKTNTIFFIHLYNSQTVLMHYMLKGNGRMFCAAFQEHLTKLLLPENLAMTVCTFNHLYQHEGAFKNTSMAYWLLNASAGRALLVKYPALLKGLRPETLNARRSAAAGKDENLSVAYWLVGTREGCALIYANPALLKGLSPETLNARRSAAAGEEENFSVAFWLFGTREGRALVQANPGLMKGLSLETLNAKCSAAAGEDENLSVAYWIVATRECRAILQTNQELLIGLSPETLNARRTAAAGADENLSVAYWIVAIRVIHPILLANPALLKGLSPETLNARCSAAAGEDENLSVAYWIVATRECRAILQTNQELLIGLSPETLNARRTAAAGADENFSVAYFLVATPEGRALIYANPALLKGLSAETLNARRPAAAGIEKNLSVAYWLFETAEGLALVQARPGLFNLSPDILSARRSDTAGTGGRISVENGSSLLTQSYFNNRHSSPSAQTGLALAQSDRQYRGT